MSDVMHCYRGRTAVVTGSSSGIGESIARQLLAAGATVWGIDRNPPQYSLDHFVLTDLGDRESIAAAVAQLPSEVWCSFNCAAVSSGGADQQTVLRVNFIGYRAFLESVAARVPPGGAIVSTASTGGRNWIPNFKDVLPLVQTGSFDEALAWARDNDTYIRERDAYRLSKEAMIIYAVSHGFELAERGVRINVVAPGVTDTPILRDAVKARGEGILTPTRPMNRLATADEQAKVHLFINSDWASYLTGEVIWVDGGGITRRILTD